MNPITTKRWLRALEPLSSIATEFFGSDMEICRTTCLRYECLYFVGSDNAEYVDRHEFEKLLWASLADATAKLPLPTLNFRQDGARATELQSTIQDMKAQRFWIMSEIGDRRSAKISEHDKQKAEIIQKQIHDLENQRDSIVRGISDFEGTLAELVRKYDLGPVVETPDSSMQSEKDALAQKTEKLVKKSKKKSTTTTKKKSSRGKVPW